MHIPTSIQSHWRPAKLAIRRSTSLIVLASCAGSPFYRNMYDVSHTTVFLKVKQQWRHEAQIAAALLGDQVLRQPPYPRGGTQIHLEAWVDVRACQPSLSGQACASWAHPGFSLSLSLALWVPLLQQLLSWVHQPRLPRIPHILFLLTHLCFYI